MKKCKDCIWYGTDGWVGYCHSPEVRTANGGMAGLTKMERDPSLRCKPEAILFEPKPTRLQKVWKFIRDVMEGWHT